MQEGTVLAKSIVVPICQKYCRRDTFWVDFCEGYNFGLAERYCLKHGLGESLFIKLQKKLSTSDSPETLPKQRYFAPKSAGEEIEIFKKYWNGVFLSLGTFNARFFIRNEI